DSIEPPVEDGETFADNARLKACYYGRMLNRLVLADDSGLIVDALEGQPGVYSARYAEGEWADRREQDRANYEKLLTKLAGISKESRTARFCCSLCVARPATAMLEVEGFLEGLIAEEPLGENGFGYDPVFWLPDKNKMVAELDAEEKNKISHRGRALRKLVKRWGTLEAGS
ncbi:MAG: RdgB/HAM1 family non-canonical purine NTP pyrophosphatase, partial [Planctomycetes bacterium]|nr:RdgB/HAM1 family non-canonical purine NTP pyrophosphatase [Planctomycetota bacterium]